MESGVDDAAFVSTSGMMSWTWQTARDRKGPSPPRPTVSLCFSYEVTKINSEEFARQAKQLGSLASEAVGVKMYKIN